MPPRSERTAAVGRERLKSAQAGGASPDESRQNGGSLEQPGEQSAEQAVERPRTRLWSSMLLLVLALAPRLLLLERTDYVIDADEAIVGLMGKHFAEGRPWAVFYYGQDYMGSLEPLLVAAVFFITGGATVAGLKFVPLMCALLHVILVYRLAQRLLRPGFAFLAAALTAVAPQALVSWSVMARGGFIEIVVIGTLALILTVDYLRRERVSAADAVLLGVVLGVGWWVNNQIAFYMLPIALVLGVRMLRQGIRFGLERGALVLAGFFLGGAPFWYANLFNSPRWASFEVLFSGSGGESRAAEYFHGLMVNALPIIFGARRFWTDFDLFAGASLLGYLVYGAAVLIVAARLVRAPAAEREPWSLLLLFVGSVGLIFSCSSFGWLSIAPRYLLPLYSMLFILLAFAAQILWRYGIAGQGVAALLVGGALTLNLASNYLPGGLRIPQPVIFGSDRVAEDHRELYRWLKEQGYRHIRTNYWVGYRVAFETNEEVTFSRFGRPRTLRIPEYEAQVVDAPEVYVLGPGEARLLEEQLRQFGVGYRRSVVGSYIVIDRLCRVWRTGEKLPLREEALLVSSKPEERAKMLDELPETRWGSGMPQQEGMFVEVQLPRPERVSGVSFDLGPFIHDAPRKLVIEGQDVSGGWSRLFQTAGTKLARDLRDQEFSEVPRLWEVSFAPVEVTAVRLRTEAGAPVFDWSIAELTVYSAPEGDARNQCPAPGAAKSAAAPL